MPQLSTQFLDRWSFPGVVPRAIRIAAVAAAAACGGRDGTSTVTEPPPAVASVRISPSVDTVLLGDSTRLSATAFDNAGNALSDRLIQWTVGTPSVARSGSLGAQVTVTALALGTTLIGATSEHQEGVARIVVVLGVPFQVLVSPATSEIHIGEMVPLTVTVKDALGHPLPGAPVTFVALDATIARVSASGVVTGVGAGQTKIVVNSRAVTDTALVRVTP